MVYTHPKHLYCLHSFRVPTIYDVNFSSFLHAEH